MNSINELLSIMKTLRNPDEGCPWDAKQSIASIAPYTLEEVYEVIDSIEKNDMEGLCSELGDLLFHIVFYAEMANENGHFDFNKVAETVSAKLIRRHPHVFADMDLDSLKKVTTSWEEIKKMERQEKAQEEGVEPRYLDDISTNMPAIMRAEKLQKRAATAGFDWHSIEPVTAKIEEELLELRREIEAGADKEKLTEEMGDLLFSCINLARHIKVEPESALRFTNRKFELRFRFIEDELEKQGVTLEQASLDQMEDLWIKAKNIRDEK